jgi:ABC-type amino acid transport substrate-binding protein
LRTTGLKFLLLFTALLVLWPWRLMADTAATIELTPEERAWIAAHPVILVGHDPTYAPYVFVGEGGELAGIDIDYLSLISRRTGLQFRNVTPGDWSHVMAEFKAGRIDLLMSLGYAEERESFLIYTEPYASAPNVIVTRTDSPYLFDL